MFHLTAVLSLSVHKLEVLWNIRTKKKKKKSIYIFLNF